MDLVTLLLNTLWAWEPATDISCLITCTQRVSQGKQDLLPKMQHVVPHWSSSADLKAQDCTAVPCRTVWAGVPDCLTWDRQSWVTVRLDISLHCST